MKQDIVFSAYATMITGYMGGSMGMANKSKCEYALVIVCILAILALCSGCAQATSQSASLGREQVGFPESDLHDFSAPIGPIVSDIAAEAVIRQVDISWRDEDFAVNPQRTDGWSFETNGRKTVYLTIDDGPSENTQAVLDILDRYGCKATFFVVGHNPDYYPMIKEAYDRGHTIGLHTYSHDYAYVYSSVDAYFYDLGQIGQIVEEQIGYVPCFVRFPGGSSNVVSANYCSGIMSALVGYVPAYGYQYYDWNKSVGDGSIHTADEIVGYATEPTELENIMLLCHDSATKQSTVEALPRIIEHYQALGYTFEAIDRSTIVVHHGVGN